MRKLYRIRLAGREMEIARDDDGKFVIPVEFRGTGTALKPALEPVTVARKPFKGTVAANVLAHGTGALNIDATRIHMSEEDADFIRRTARPNTAGQAHTGDVMNRPATPTVNVHAAGRWPANLILTYPEEQYMLRDDVTPDQLHKLAEWMNENAKH
jgi:hypothetical protein